MSIAGNQRQVLLRLLAELRPFWRREQALPARIQALFARHRAFGARDRRLYRELIYTTLRYLPWIEPLLNAEPEEAVRRIAWLAGDIPAARLFRAEFATGTPPTGDLAELLPGWFHEHCPEAFAPEQLRALLARAPLWIRLQDRDAARIASELSTHGWSPTRFAELDSAWRLPDDANVTQNAAYREGRIEIQDLGSQLILASIGVTPGEQWLDACAGAGGKTLQLAQLLGAGGHIHAHDIRRDALDELRTRAARAGIPVTTAANRSSRMPLASRIADRPAAAITILDQPPPPSARFAGVLVDAPCSGTGTWRRAPHLKWSTTPEHIARAAAGQSELLRAFSQHVAPGGRLIYATCSLSRRENDDIVAGFLATHPRFKPAPFVRTFGFPVRGHGLTILPATHNTDGFFVASLHASGA